jgi:hypothetical protein
MAELQADRRVGVGMHEVGDALPATLLLIVPQAGAARSDACLGGNAGHLGHHQAGAAECAAAQVHEQEVRGQAVLAGIHGHGRDDDAVLQGQVAQLERREHRRQRLRRQAALLREPGLDAVDVGLVAQAQVLVADALAAGEERVGVLLGFEVGIARHVLEPLHAVARRALQLEGFDLALFLVEAGRVRRRRGERAGARGAMASSIASLVPEPMEKCAVWAASPISTMFL